ncbi:MAG: helix-turn-helix transcriptional regulator [Bacteroidales bacterium]
MLEQIVFTLPMFVTLFWSVTLVADFRLKDKPRSVLALFMFLATILYASHAIYFSKNYGLYAFLDPLYTLTSLSVFPMFYIYIKAVAKEGGASMKDLLLFTPAIFFGITSALSFIAMGPEELEAFILRMEYKESISYSFSAIGKIQIFLYKMSRIVFTLQIIPSVFQSWKLISAYEKKIKEFYSSTEEKTLAWARDIMIAMVSAALFSLVVNSLGKAFFIKQSMLLMIPSILFSIVLYSIGFLGFRQRYSIANYEKDIQKDNVNGNRFAGDEIRGKLSAEIICLLENEQIFRNNNLRITDISEKLKTNRSYISGIVNTEFKTNFSDLINRYRIEYSKKLLLDEKIYVLDYIAEQSGFASLSSFMRVFRNETGITPGIYRKQNINLNKD